MTTVSSDTTAHTFTGVLKSRTYNVTVLATNVIGEGTLAHTTIGELCEGIEIVILQYMCMYIIAVTVLR